MSCVLRVVQKFMASITLNQLCFICATCSAFFSLFNLARFLSSLFALLNPRLKIGLLKPPRPQHLEAGKVAFLGEPIDRFFVNVQERRNIPNGHGWFHKVWLGHPPSAQSLTEN
jgi:hypothetical protein